MTDLISSELEDDQKNSWGTDPVIFRAMDKEFNFKLDAAANNENYLCPDHLTKEDDAISVDWRDYLYKIYGSEVNLCVWINPPYGKGYIKKFMHKCIEQKENGVTSVMLVPATLESGWLNFDAINEIRIITGGRLSFINPITNKKMGGNTRGSMFVIFRGNDKSPCFTRLVDRDYLLSLGGGQFE